MRRQDAAGGHGAGGDQGHDGAQPLKSCDVGVEVTADGGDGHHERGLVEHHTGQPHGTQGCGQEEAWRGGGSRTQVRVMPVLHDHTLPKVPQIGTMLRHTQRLRKGVG